MNFYILEQEKGDMILTWKDVNASKNRFNGIIQAMIFKLGPDQSVVVDNLMTLQKLRERKKDIAPATRSMILDGFQGYKLINVQRSVLRYLL